MDVRLAPAWPRYAKTNEPAANHTEVKAFTAVTPVSRLIRKKVNTGIKLRVSRQLETVFSFPD